MPRALGAVTVIGASLMLLALSGCGPVEPTLNNVNGHGSNGTTGTTPSQDMGETTPVDMGPPVVEISVASFNVEELWDTVCDSRCGSSDFEKELTQGQFDAKIERIQQRILDALDADVIILQEIENQRAFDALTQPLADTYPTRVFGELGFDGTLDIGIISKLGTTGTQTYRDEQPLFGGGGDRFAREFLRVDLAKGSKRVSVFGAHFISKLSDNDARRRAEADTAAKIATDFAAANPEVLVVLGGDLNDTPESNTLRAMFSAGLVSPAQSLGLTTSEYYSFTFRGEREVIDHLLYVDGPDFGYIADSVRAVHDDGRSGLAGSDHGAVQATFTVVE